MASDNEKGIFIRIIAALTLAALLACAVGCGGRNGDEGGPSQAAAGLRRIGDGGYGYITIPSSWTDNHALRESLGRVQASSPDGASVITIMYYESLELETATEGLSAHLAGAGATDIEMTPAFLDGGSIAPVSRTTCYYPETEGYCMFYLFSGPDGLTHYICAEGSTAGALQIAVDIVEGTFSFEK